MTGETSSRQFDLFAGAAGSGGRPQEQQATVPSHSTASSATDESPSADQPVLDDPFRNLISEYLSTKHKESTRSAYRADLHDFFQGDPTPSEVRAFISASPEHLRVRVNRYKSHLAARKLSKATMNRRMAPLRELLKFAQAKGLRPAGLDHLVDNEPTNTRAFVRGDRNILDRLFNAPGTDSVRGLRDTATLLVLGETALNRAAAVGLDVKDVIVGSGISADALTADGTAAADVAGEGTAGEGVAGSSLPGTSSSAQGTLHVAKERDDTDNPGQDPAQQEADRVFIPLSGRTLAALMAYLQAAGHAADTNAPLFRNLDHRPDKAGARLTEDGIYKLVKHYGESIDAPHLTPRQLRRLAIASAWEEAEHDLYRITKRLPHIDPSVLQRYKVSLGISQQRGRSQQRDRTQRTGRAKRRTASTT
jgi:site-specific recombinase XerD